MTSAKSQKKDPVPPKQSGSRKEQETKRIKCFISGSQGNQRKVTGKFNVATYSRSTSGCLASCKGIKKAKCPGILKKLIACLLLTIFSDPSSIFGKKGILTNITKGIQIMSSAQAIVEASRTNAHGSQTDINKTQTAKVDPTESGKYFITPSMSLVRRRHIPLSPFIDADVYGDITLIVLDTEGLAYHTSFTRKLLWVTKITDNLLNVKKPYVHTEPDTCAIDNFAGAETKWRKHAHEKYDDAKEDVYNNGDHSCEEDQKKPILGRHLVPSYDGYIYCVYENNHAQLLHIHVRDIVNYTPFRTPLLEGVYLEGSRNSSVMALDYDTGNYITRHVKTDILVHADHTDEFGNRIKRHKQLHIGYTDWTVRAYDETSHEELWSFNWREIGAVNTDQLDTVTIERIREVVKVKGKRLHIMYDENDEEATQELNYPFPIAVVFAVMWNVQDEIMTVQVLERISIPPPPEFLQNSLTKTVAALSLKSSNHAEVNVLSVKNGVINLDDTWETKLRLQEHPTDGSLIEIKTVDPHYYYSNNTQVQKVNIVHHIHTEKKVMNFWFILGWLFTFLTIPVIWILRRIFRYTGLEKMINMLSKLPLMERIIERVSRTIETIEQMGFDSTQRLIHNIDRASQIYPVNVVYEKITSLPGVTPEQMQMEGNVNNRAQLALLNTLHNMTMAANAGANQTETRGAGEVALNEPQSESSIKSISVVPHGTPLEGFLENGRFIRTFECLQILGKGGFGSVYMVQHKLEPGHPIYAMKFVLLWLRPSEGLGSRRYFREVSANREIYSKYVVRYYTWWCEEPHFLPMMQLSPDIRAAAALNIKHLISTNALTSQDSKELTCYLQQYQDAVRDIVERSTEDSYPSFSKIAFNRTTRAQMRKTRATLEAIGEHSELSNDWNYDSDDSIAGSPVFKFAENAQEKRDNDGNNSQQSEISYQYSDSGVDIVFEDSEAKEEEKLEMSEEPKEAPKEEPKEAEKEQQVKPPVETAKQTKTRARGAGDIVQKDVEKEYPAVLLIMMELCKGCTLREWLNRPDRSEVPLDYTKGPGGTAVEFYFFKQLIKGLRDIHANNFIHRDLKPENIFVDPVSYALKIGDFGLVAIISHTNSNTDDSKLASPVQELNDEGEQVSLPGQVIGTPGYTAPEGGVKCTEKADIYSAGLILLELLLPRFSTSMERCSVLENFRTSRAVPSYIKEQLRPWYVLLWNMADPEPSKRPTATVIHRTLKAIMGSPKSELME